MEIPESDLFALVLRPLDHAVHTGLSAAGWSAPLVDAAIELLHAVEACLLASGVALGLAAARRHTERQGKAEGQGRGAAITLIIIATAVALAAWIARRPSPDVGSLLGRFDHLMLCALGGYALSYVRPQARKWLLTGMSVYLLNGFMGWRALVAVLSAAAVGYAILQLRARTSLWLTLVVQGAAFGVVYAWTLYTRPVNLLAAWATEGLLKFVLLRQISFLIEVRRGRPAGLANYLCYMLFYPSCIGASEVYDEFYDRNLSGPARFDYRGAVRHIVLGRAQIWLALLLPVSFEATIQIQHSGWLWLHVLALFVRSSLYIMGFWAIITGCALFYGIELRPNFAGILRCENPSQFWRAWRGTMTHWLIRYVYIPLGGNRRRQSRNIAAAFAVSTAWHWMGLPFMGAHPTAWAFTPMGLWGVLNALGVIAYAYARRRAWRLLPASTPDPVRRGTKIFLTACFGTLTVTLLGIGPDMMGFFLPFVRTLVGAGS